MPLHTIGGATQRRHFFLNRGNHTRDHVFSRRQGGLQRLPSALEDSDMVKLVMQQSMQMQAVMMHQMMQVQNKQNALSLQYKQLGKLPVLPATRKSKKRDRWSRGSYLSRLPSRISTRSGSDPPTSSRGSHRSFEVSPSALPPNPTHPSHLRKGWQRAQSSQPK